MAQNKPSHEWLALMLAAKSYDQMADSIERTLRSTKLDSGMEAELAQQPFDVVEQFRKAGSI